MSETTPAPTEALDEELSVERSLAKAILIGVLIAVPICSAIWVVIVALAVGGSDWDLGPALLMAAGVGVLAGLFFGGWAGVVAKVHDLDAADMKAARGAH